MCVHIYVNIHVTLGWCARRESQLRARLFDFLAVSTAPQSIRRAGKVSRSKYAPRLCPRLFRPATALPGNSRGDKFPFVLLRKLLEPSAAFDVQAGPSPNECRPRLFNRAHRCSRKRGRTTRGPSARLEGTLARVDDHFILAEITEAPRFIRPRCVYTLSRDFSRGIDCSLFLGGIPSRRMRQVARAVRSESFRKFSHRHARKENGCRRRSFGIDVWNNSSV